MTAYLDLPDFRNRALCASGDYPADLWFPPSGGLGAQQAERAKDVCNGTNGQPACPARDECAAYAIPRWRLHGVFGGMSAKERDAARGTPRQSSHKRAAS